MPTTESNDFRAVSRCPIADTLRGYLRISNDVRGRGVRETRCGRCYRRYRPLTEEVKHYHLYCSDEPKIVFEDPRSVCVVFPELKVGHYGVDWMLRSANHQEAKI